ncbi:hypothetical protein Mp_2g09950 [Marchantia polymorpha subsp. ruderalis]|uniref:Uncharacterized protein n=1 Tax=Marchantia polymorpha TaxID=3197 RepID=A0A2R6W8I8_MARPO|nr:hypothetical protein MARPO_0129s0021 [Marchantia polymorpha]BBN01748.1 hypothetical protein Mp_2g09950 [Marchantia polymorpha subsp. ruderalis]|eukprot:PTQ30132.1 hypothetical protein MARPO_0129s0021 [Marchantia polymorpha]
MTRPSVINLPPGALLPGRRCPSVRRPSHVAVAVASGMPRHNERLVEPHVRRDVAALDSPASLPSQIPSVRFRHVAVERPRQTDLFLGRRKSAGAHSLSESLAPGRRPAAPEDHLDELGPWIGSHRRCPRAIVPFVPAPRREQRPVGRGRENRGPDYVRHEQRVFETLTRGSGVTQPSMDCGNTSGPESVET